MSPVSLRRFRAERLLIADFARLRARVLAGVRSHLGGAGRALDAGDLEACYAQAWHGLYAAVAAGEDVANPAGWLVTVTSRRAIEEVRSRARETCAGDELLAEHGCEPDPIERLEAARQLREVCEALRSRLSAREREAATLCYLLGFSRAEAAARMGISDRRMRKLMEGDGAGRRGVAGKVGELLALIQADRWCEEQGSLMRALALGVLEPGGERYVVARIHERECPGCRRFVAAVRSLAAVLPPLLPHGALIGGLGAGAGLGARAATTKGAAGAGGGSGLFGAGSLAAGSTVAASTSTGGFGSLVGSLALKAALGALALGASGAIVAVDMRAHPRPAGRPRPGAAAAAVLSASAGGPPAGRLAGEAQTGALAGQSAPAGSASGARDPSLPSRTSSGASSISAAVRAASSEFGIEALAGAEAPSNQRSSRARGAGRARLAARAGSSSQVRRSRRSTHGEVPVATGASFGQGAGAAPAAASSTQGAQAPAGGVGQGAGSESVQGAAQQAPAESTPSGASAPGGHAAEGEFSFE